MERSLHFTVRWETIILIVVWRGTVTPIEGVGIEEDGYPHPCVPHIFIVEQGVVYSRLHRTSYSVSYLRVRGEGA